MTLKKILGLGIMASLGIATVSVAEDATFGTTNAAPAYQPITLGIEGGTTGIGGAVRWRFADHFGLRAGVDYLTYSGNKTYQGVNYSGDLRLQSAPLTLDIFPWQDRSFYISLGAAYNQNRLTGKATPLTDIQIGDNTYTPSEVGTLNLKIEPALFSPYLSIGGNFYFDKARHWSLSTELGVMYGGIPDVTLTSSGGGVDPADLASMKQQIQNGANYTKFWPVIKLGLNFSF